MAGGKRDKRSFWSYWTTLPGILTGAAALIGSVTALITALVAAGTICTDDHNLPTPTPPATASVMATITPTPQPSPSPFAHATLQDLELGEIRIERTNFPGNEYDIVATITNNGNGVADGFNIAATYRCLPGEQTIGAGLDIIQGTYIMAKSTATYRAPFHYQCLAHPPSLALTVIVTDREGQEKTFFRNPDLP